MTMSFEAVVVEVREAKDRIEILFRGRPAYLWFVGEPQLEKVARGSLEQESALRVEWDPVDGRIVSLANGDAR